MVLPASSEFPPLPYAAVLLAAMVLVGWRLRGVRPSVDDRTVLALAPWMVAGSGGYACYQLELVPGVIAPFASSPTVYATTFAVAGAVWLAAARVRSDPPVHLALAGVAAALVPVGVALAAGVRNDSLALAWPLGGALVAVEFHLQRRQPRRTVVVPLQQFPVDGDVELPGHRVGEPPLVARGTQTRALVEQRVRDR